MPIGTYERIKKIYDTLPLKTETFPRAALWMFDSDKGQNLNAYNISTQRIKCVEHCQ